MTPRTVIFSLSEGILVEEFFYQYNDTPFSRILIYDDNKDNITGFVLLRDLLLAQARGNAKNALKNYRRDISALINTASLSHAFSEMLRQRAQIILIVDEYGTINGILTMEDLFETLLGLEIVDERDKNADMQELARKVWLRKSKDSSLKIDK